MMWLALAYYLMVIPWIIDRYGFDQPLGLLGLSVLMWPMIAAPLWFLVSDLVRMARRK